MKIIISFSHQICMKILNRAGDVILFSLHLNMCHPWLYLCCQSTAEATISLILFSHPVLQTVPPCRMRQTQCSSADKDGAGEARIDGSRLPLCPCCHAVRLLLPDARILYLLRAGGRWQISVFGFLSQYLHTWDKGCTVRGIAEKQERNYEL